MYYKVCFKCGGLKPITEFYKHKAMADVRVNKCKECNKVDVKSNRKSKIEYYREYDRESGNRQKDGYVKEYRSRNPIKYNCHTILNNAIRDGKINKKPCEVCGNDKAVANHDDYSKPMDVRWLCQAHHMQWHAENGE
ncbi:endonuclease [Escherichia virus ECH1]